METLETEIIIFRLVLKLPEAGRTSYLKNITLERNHSCCTPRIHLCNFCSLITPVQGAWVNQLARLRKLLSPAWSNRKRNSSQAHETSVSLLVRRAFDNVFRRARPAFSGQGLLRDSS